MMAIEDHIAESVRILRCEGCGQVIHTTTYQRRYCSDSHTEKEAPTRSQVTTTARDDR